jgi:hypothetical protein
MSRERSGGGGHRGPGHDHKPRGRELILAGVVGLAVAALVGMVIVYCRDSSRKGSMDEPAKVRLRALFGLYQTYTNQKRKPPPNEDAFKDFIRGLPSEEKNIAGIGDADGFLVSPRDGQKYVILYNRAIDFGGPTRAVAWERQGKNGKRYVALSVGYVEEYDEETFKSYLK